MEFIWAVNFNCGTIEIPESSTLLATGSFLHQNVVTAVTELGGMFDVKLKSIHIIKLELKALART